MFGKCFGVLLAGLAVVVSASSARADGCGTPCPPPCGPAVGGPAYVTQKVLVTEYRAEQYEGTVTRYKTEYKDEKYTYYKCETTPQEMTRKVTYYKTVPVTTDQVVTRYECQPVTEERTVTRAYVSCKPVQQMVTRTVDKGGSYVCQTVVCGYTRTCDGCCVPVTRTVQTYVPNCVTEQVAVTVMQNVVEHKTEKVNVTSYKTVAKQETVKVTTYQCQAEPREEKYTVYTSKMVPVEGVRKVAVCTPVEEKAMLTRMVPVQVEREVIVSTSGGGGYTACCSSGGGLFRRCR